jgi:hypothetical protein
MPELVSLPRLRVGIFCDVMTQPRWVVEALARAGASAFAEIALISDTQPVDAAIPLTPPNSLSTAGLLRRQDGKNELGGEGGKSKGSLIWRAYVSADRAVFGRGWDGWRESDVSILVPKERRLSRSMGERCWRAKIADARLDVAFVLGDVDNAAIEDVARYGVWRFCFGDSHGTCQELAGVREAIEAAPVTMSGLRIHRRGERDRVACQSFARTYPFSIAKSRGGVFAKTGEFVSRALRDLHAGGERWIEMGTEPARDPAPQAVPGLRDLSRLGAHLAARAKEKALTLDTWSIAYRFGNGDEAWSGSLEGFHRLTPPAGWFWADPFPIERDGRHWIFFEELPKGASKAHISVVEVDREGNASKPERVLERDYHLSYPFLVEEDGVLFMIPETADNRTVEIYRCEQFPNRWTLERVLLKDLFACDATLHREDGRWWMFANAAAHGSEVNDELHLFSAPTLMGEWTPHRRNPVKSDVRSSRPAGRLFRRGDGLYRPGQICTPLYGAGIALHRVTHLSIDNYAEEEHARIVPADSATLGIHTFNRAGDLTVTDAFERRPRFHS